MGCGLISHVECSRSYLCHADLRCSYYKISNTTISSCLFLVVARLFLCSFVVLWLCTFLFMETLIIYKIN